MYKQINKCRICGNTELITILDLGQQYLTGVFPVSIAEPVTKGPLELVKCNDEDRAGACGLVQLRHSYDCHEMYGSNYGYRSGLNKTMVAHLHQKVMKIREIVRLKKGDLVLDIGSNDSTLLRAYRQDGLLLTGIDPTGEKFRKYYPEHIQLIPDFFSAAAVKNKWGSRKAKVVTSIAMFYDLESPPDFAGQIAEILADDGVWVFEQSYLPTMLKMNAYDTVCHEHLEYYCLKQIKWITDKAGLKIINIEFNSINGGSFSVCAAKRDSPHKECTGHIQTLLADEGRQLLNTISPYEQFKVRVFSHRAGLAEFLKRAKAEHKVIFGYGASTKGNVILQFCDVSAKDIPYIAEVNPDKFGRFTPGTNIPIIPEEDAKKLKPDYFMVLPWHFRDNVIERQAAYVASGGKLLFPLPSLEVI